MWRAEIAAAVWFILASTPGRAASDVSCRLPPEDARWYQVASRHFTVLGNTSARTVAASCAHLERTLAALETLTPMRLGAGAHIPVLLLGSGPSFGVVSSAVAPWLEVPFAGLYVTQNFERSIIASAGVVAPVERTLAHELAHALVRETMPRPPYWLDEGLAEFYATIEIGGTAVRLGLAPQEHVLKLRKKAWWAFDELLALRSGPSWNEVHSGREPPVAEAWALVHYLLVGAPKRSGQLARYLTAVQQGTAAPSAFGAAFGATPAELQSEVLGYVQRWRCATTPLSAPRPGFTTGRPRSSPSASTHLTLRRRTTRESGSSRSRRRRRSDCCSRAMPRVRRPCLERPFP